jgi:D-sedoheptulose 7-phosphate isomerase
MANTLMKPHAAASLAGLWGGAGQLLRSHLRTSIETKQQVLKSCEPDILAAAARITGSLREGGKLLLCGNGGSAADCQHIAAELVIRLTQDFVRPGLPAIALTTDTSMLTAGANDFGFARVFERQVQALGRAGDVLVAISTSGDSENTLCALNYAFAHGIHTIALTGAAAGKLTAAEIVVRIPSTSTQHIQEAHITVGHIICAIVERSLFPEAI